ncbi:MAG: isoprenylcysteine carboxylmethyltransferase family protein [Desulfobacterales bacterium]
MSLKTKWIDIVYKLATGSRKVRTLLTPLGAITFGLFTLVFVVVSVQLDRLLKMPKLLAVPLNIIASIPILSLGLIMTGWSILSFLKVKGTPVPFNPPPRLVTSGPYAYVRNPMLSGIFLLLFGLGTLLNSFFLFILFTPLFIAINVWELKMIEEPELERRLGEAYHQYRQKTPMFIPGVKAIFKKKRC